MITFTAIFFTHMISYIFTKKINAFSTAILLFQLPWLLLLSSCSVMSDSLWHHVLQHTRLPCPSPSPGACSCPLNWWCHPTISSSVVPFSSCVQSFPASGPFLVNRLYESGGRSAGASARDIALPRLRDLRERERSRRKGKVRKSNQDGILSILISEMTFHHINSGMCSSLEVSH